MKNVLRSSRGFVPLAILLLATACTAPDDVRKFAALSAEATAQFPALANDLAGSCVRKQLADRPITEIEQTDDAARTACKEFFDLQPRLATALAVLTDYLNALHELASDRAVNFDAETGRAAQALQQTGVFGSAPADAVKSLAGFLAKAAGSRYQKRQLAEALKSTDADIDALTKALMTIVDQDYPRVLDNEQNALRERYRGFLVEDRTKNPVAILMVKDKWNTDLESLNRRRTAARDCREILRRIRDGHHALAEAAERKDEKAVAAATQPHLGPIRALLGNFQKAF